MVGALAASVLLTLTGCEGAKPKPVVQPKPAASSSPTVFQINGSITLDLPDFVWDDDSSTCVGTGGYDDIHVGAQTVVTDAAGTTIAVGSIVDDIPQVGDLIDGTARATSCVFRFRVQDVPADKGFYGVEVSHRGRLQYPEAEASKELTLTLG